MSIVGCGILCLVVFLLTRPEALTLISESIQSPTASSTITPRPTRTLTLTPSRTPTRTPTPTATVPHLLITPPGQEIVFEENFDSNKNDWSSSSVNTTVTVSNGHLSMRSGDAGYESSALCRGCPSFGQSFYYQGELRTTSVTYDTYGLMFCAPEYAGNYYIFVIDAQNKSYVLFRRTDTDWATLIKYTRSNLINGFPRSNTLGVLYDRGAMQLYINGVYVDSYTSKEPPTCRRVGFSFSGSEIDIIADNIFAYKLMNNGSQTPSP